MYSPFATPKPVLVIDTQLIIGSHTNLERFVDTSSLSLVTLSVLLSSCMGSSWLAIESLLPSESLSSSFFLFFSCSFLCLALVLGVRWVDRGLRMIIEGSLE